MEPADRIIVPLDVSTMAAAIAWLDRLPDVTFWKVGLELFVSAGPDILHLLKTRQKRIFLDLKFHDIPNTVAGACRAALQYEVDFITLHPTAGRTAMAAAVEAIAESSTSRPKLLGVSLLTSLTSRELALRSQNPVRIT